VLIFIDYGCVSSCTTDENTPYILTRDSQPKAALIPYAEYQRFQRLQNDELWREMDGLLERMTQRNNHFTDEEVAADIEDTIREVRAETGS
ncbi:MAG: hypothetical protein KJZ86_23655, partial [Caldilineaceae bacterium]|nr:hypothetical protein [Caldilineaceae bacterium]HRJ44380.1 hypothetical protein [Caldilineaceae bacterium]